MPRLYEGLTGSEGNLIPELIGKVGKLYFLRNNIREFSNACGGLPDFENLAHVIWVVSPDGVRQTLVDFLGALWENYRGVRAGLTDSSLTKHLEEKKKDLAKRMKKIKQTRTIEEINEDAEFYTEFAPIENEILSNYKKRILGASDIVKKRTELFKVCNDKLEEILAKTDEMRLINLAMASYIANSTNIVGHLEEDSEAKIFNINYFKYQIALPELSSLFELLGNVIKSRLDLESKEVNEAFITPSPLSIVNKKINPQTETSLGTVESSLLYCPNYSFLGYKGYVIVDSILKEVILSAVKDEKEARKIKTIINSPKLFQRLRTASASKEDKSVLDLLARNPSVVSYLFMFQKISDRLREQFKKEKIEDIDKIKEDYLDFITDWRKAEALFPAINRISNLEDWLISENKKVKLNEEYENGNVYWFDKNPIINRKRRTVLFDIDMRDSGKLVELIDETRFNELFGLLLENPRAEEIRKNYKASVSFGGREAGDEELYFFTGLSYPALSSLSCARELLQELKITKKNQESKLTKLKGKEVKLDFGSALYMAFVDPEKRGYFDKGTNIVRDLAKSAKINGDSKKLEEMPSVYLTEKGIYNHGLIIAENCKSETKETFVKSLEEELEKLNRLEDFKEIENEFFYKKYRIVKDNNLDIRLKSSTQLIQEGEDPIKHKGCLDYWLYKSLSEELKKTKGEIKMIYLDEESKEHVLTTSEEFLAKAIRLYCSNFVTYSTNLIETDNSIDKQYPLLIEWGGKEGHQLRTHRLKIYSVPIDYEDFNNFISYIKNGFKKTIYEKAAEAKAKGQTKEKAEEQTKEPEAPSKEGK